MAKRGIPTKKFEGFTVAVDENSSMECNYWIPKLNVTLGNYQMTDSFYVVDVADTHSIRGSMALFNREIYYKLPRNGNGIPGARWKTCSFEGHEHLSPKTGLFTENGGSTQIG